jgi:hypothetical protein
MAEDIASEGASPLHVVIQNSRFRADPRPSRDDLDTGLNRAVLAPFVPGGPLWLPIMVWQAAVRRVGSARPNV